MNNNNVNNNLDSENVPGVDEDNNIIGRQQKSLCAGSYISFPDWGDSMKNMDNNTVIAVCALLTVTHGPPKSKDYGSLVI